MTDIKVPENEGTTASAGISQTQLEQEAAISAKIQAQRQETDAHMRLQVNRATEKGDVASLSQEEQTQLFNPDGTHRAEVVQQRVVNYTAEHNRISMPEGRERPMVRGVGHDARTNTQRMPGPGEAVDAAGSIVLVDPRFAEEQAEKMRNVNEADAKNTMARSQAMTQLCATLSVRPHDVIGAVYCNFSQSRQYVQIYEEQSGEGIRDADTDFLPLRQYVHKFRTLPDGRVVPRPILPNEVGVFQKGKAAGKILCLNDKDLAKTDTTVQVPRAQPRPSQLVAGASNPAPSPVVATSGFTVSSQVPVTVTTPRTSVATQTPLPQPATPAQPVVSTQPAPQQRTTTRMNPIVPSQGHGAPTVQTQVPRGNPKLPPPPKGFK